MCSDLIDWDAVAAIGTWVGAAATALAVFIAARLASTGVNKAEILRVLNRATVAMLIYVALKSAIADGAKDNGKLPDANSVAGYLEVLREIDPLELGTAGSVLDLLLMQRAASALQDAIEVQQKDPFYGLPSLRQVCGELLPDVERAAEAMVDHVTGLSVMAGRAARYQLRRDPWWALWQRVGRPVKAPG